MRLLYKVIRWLSKNKAITKRQLMPKGSPMCFFFYNLRNFPQRMFFLLLFELIWNFMPSFVSTINFIDCFFFEWLTPFVIRLVRLADCKSKTYPSCSTQCHNRVTRSCSVFHRLSSLNPSHSKFLLTVSSGFLVLGGSAITRLSN